MVNQEEQNRQMQQIIAKCWSDESFKEKLMADPHATLAAEGVEIFEGVNINVLSNTADTFHLVIPAKPEDMELSDEDLDRVTGGYGWCGCFFGGLLRQRIRLGLGKGTQAAQRRTARNLAVRV